MLERNGIKCSPEEAKSINLNQRRGQLPATHAKYKEAIAACDRQLEYIECNVSEIAREFGLSGTNLGPPVADTLSRSAGVSGTGTATPGSG